MSELWLLRETQMRRIEPYFPLSHRVPRIDDQRIISGIIFVIRTGLRWRDAPAGATMRTGSAIPWSSVASPPAIPSKTNRKEPIPHETAPYR